MTNDSSTDLSCSNLTALQGFMKNKFSILIFSLVVMFLFGSLEQIFACSCVPETQCNKFQNSDVVFVGKAVEVIEEKPAIFSVYFEVSEVFKGVKLSEKVRILSSQNDDGGCGYKFNLNEVYLVQAKNSKDSIDVSGLWSSQCSGNKHIKYAKESLGFLRVFTSNTSESFIVGKVEEIIGKDISQRKPMENVKVKARLIGRRKQVFYGTTDTNGSYKIKVLVGTYIITPELSKEYIFGVFDEKKHKPINVENQNCNGKFFIVEKKKE